MAGYEGLQFTPQIQAFVGASGGGVWITSGFRSPQKQQQLWDAALRKYGDPEIADNWVARPGSSNHEKGMAVDLGFRDQAAREWAHANAARFGLHFPMEWEPWHIEPLGSTLGASRGAYTTPPGGFINPRDQMLGGMDPTLAPEDPYDAGVQMKRLVEVIAAGPDAADALMASPDMSLMASPTMEGAGVEPESQAAAVVEHGADQHTHAEPEVA